ncbi:MAG: NBR1-Ig-like domain-containing protein [Anaerolineales bacterium]
MNKKAITLICIVLLIAALQLACSFTDLIGSWGEEVEPVPPRDSGLSQPKPEDQAEDQSTSEEQNPLPVANQSSCTKAFAGSINLSEGQEFQSGEIIQVIFTLVNTGTCTWDSGYSLVEVGGDLSPSSDHLTLAGDVAASESVQLQVEYTAPAQQGPYLSVWKMADPQGSVFGKNDPLNAPLKIAIRSIPSGNQQPNPTATPNPTPTPNPGPQPAPESNPYASLEMDGVTLLEGHCYDLNNGAEVACNDSKADLKYQYSFLGAKMVGINNTDLGPNQDDEPDKTDCENTAYAPLPHSILVEKFFCFKIDPVISTYYGWIRIERFDESGVTFDFLDFKADPPEAVVNNNLFVETQGDQITLLEGQCFDVQNGTLNTSCSGIFAGFLYEGVTKKSLQVMQINPNEATFAPAMSSEPSKSDCQNASYSTTPIWTIQETSYYCYKFVTGPTVNYGWLRPTSFNSSGMTFDYLTWKALP